jgi:hypothetical protein
MTRIISSPKKRPEKDLSETRKEARIPPFAGECASSGSFSRERSAAEFSAAFSLFMGSDRKVVGGCRYFPIFSVKRKEGIFVKKQEKGEPLSKG